MEAKETQLGMLQQAMVTVMVDKLFNTFFDAEEKSTQSIGEKIQALRGNIPSVCCKAW